MSSDRFILMILLFSPISEQYPLQKPAGYTLTLSHCQTPTSLTSQSDILRALTDWAMGAMLVDILGIFECH